MAKEYIVMKDGEELKSMLSRWLANPEEAAETGRRAAALVASRAGATDRMVRRVLG